uniref:Coiled-coil domain-containing protein 25 n=1 Tax=Parascaris univalens TaxID=6257 RepID=A0A915BXL0_PARUN
MHPQLVSVQFRNLMDRSSRSVGDESNNVRRALDDATSDDELSDAVCSVSSPVVDTAKRSETQCDEKNDGNSTNETELSRVNSKNSFVYVETQPEDVLNAKNRYNEGDAHESGESLSHEHRSESSQSPSRSLTPSTTPSFSNYPRVAEVSNSSSTTTVVGFTKSRMDSQSTRQIFRNRRHHRSSSDFPLIYKTPGGTISVLLRYGIVVEISVDRCIRIVCHNKFAATCNNLGNASCILHHRARIFQQDEKIFCNFGNSISPVDKVAVFGTQGVLFTMSHLNEAYLVSSATVKGISSVSLGRLKFPNLNYDFTLCLFYMNTQTGQQFESLCDRIIREARHMKDEDGRLTIVINDIRIKQSPDGDIEVSCRPRHITCSPARNTVRIRTTMIDMAVQEDEKAYVKHESKRVHVSCSGMVVSDGIYITSMDHLGRIVSAN